MVYYYYTFKVDFNLNTCEHWKAALIANNAAKLFISFNSYIIIIIIMKAL